ncbi:MAG TPA: hypothetical protein VGP06_10495 [Janthinobacterium sp.]|jgi:hypothetical protein|nr:hypothetical protein [Janthinobacterium sp.]
MKMPGLLVLSSGSSDQHADAEGRRRGDADGDDAPALAQFELQA